ncbi:MAG: L-threonylcarbamoyladenylate synthase [Candidatus Micrarchaeota archaeon]
MVLILDAKTALAIEEAVKVLEQGKILIYPTDTVYGIGCDATSEKAVAKVYKIKKIAKEKPLSVIVADMDMVKEYCKLNKEQEETIRKKLPGPYTFLLKKKKEIASSRGNKLGIRIPEDEFCIFLCKRFGKPIVTTSANITKQKPAHRLDEVDKKVLESSNLAVDGGETKYKRPSAIIDLVEGKKIR